MRQRGSRSVAIGHNKATRELLRSPGHRKLNKTKITELREKVTLIITQITTTTLTRPGSASGKPKLYRKRVRRPQSITEATSRK